MALVKLLSLEDYAATAQVTAQRIGNALRAGFNTLLSDTENLIEQSYPTAYPARFFSNVQKIGVILEYDRTGVLPAIDAT